MNVWAGERENAGAPVVSSGFRWKSLWETASGLWKNVNIRRKRRVLHLEETLALGERRMLAIVEWKGEKLLLGVTPQQITLLEPRGAGPRNTMDSQDEAQAE
ncbi:MAG TPA: flagellar biosynthetic protein FliO [Candidatus Acidoferrum sp.]|nr:flagellar biosynthetic protein FliO [Candidatus Acidoferrum sp.]